jgi:hypothetical protein
MTLYTIPGLHRPVKRDPGDGFTDFPKAPAPVPPRGVPTWRWVAAGLVLAGLTVLSGVR